MASTAPSKSRPLHNFELPRLKWNKDPKSSALHQRRRSFKSPMRRPNPSSLSPLIDSPMTDSVSATPPHRQSPLRDSVSTAAAPCLQSPLRDFVSAAAPRRRSPLIGSSAATPRRQSPSAATSFSSRESSDYSVKQSPFSGESSSKRMKRSPIGGDVAKRPPVPVDWTRKSQIGGELVNRSPVRGDSVRHFPGRDSELESSKRSKGASIEHRKNHSKSPGFDGPKIGGSEPMNKSERGTEKLEKKSKTVEVKKSSKLLIKIPCKNNKKKPVENLKEEPAKVEPIAEVVNKADEVQEEEKINDDDNNKNNNNNNNNNSSNNNNINNNNNNNNNNMSIDEEAKIWNLRPRKPKCKTLNGNGGGGAAKKGGSTMPEKNKAQSSPLKNVNSKSGGKEVCVGSSSGGEKKEKEKEKKEKLTINVSLTKEEIEEDIFALTGSKPARRPKKRAKNIQKQLDYVFPGLWLVSITPETYKVSENYMKG